MCTKKRGKRLAGILLSACLLFSSFSPAAAESAASAAPDIKGHWAQQEMQSFIDQGLMQGDGAGSYMPDSGMTRAQFAAMINRIAGLTEEADISAYTDITKNAWHYKDLAKAAAAGYMKGTSETTFSPDTVVTREESVTMLARLLGLKATEDDIRALNRYADLKDVKKWAVEAFAAMVKAGYITGTSENTLSPAATLTRAQGITILHRSQSKIKNPGTALTTELKDGVYTGTGAGYGGTIKVEVTVEKGKITDIRILTHGETGSYLKRNEALLKAILEKQTTSGVDSISGATKTSQGLLTAIEACLSQARGGKDTSQAGATGGGGGGGGGVAPPTGQDFGGNLKNGVYTGAAIGYGGPLTVEVTVEGGRISAIRILSHSETHSYLDRAIAVIPSMISAQSTKVDAVSNATFSSYGIINAVANALKQAAPDDPSGAKVHQAGNWSELISSVAKAGEGDIVRLTADITDAGRVDGVSSPTLTINKKITLDGNNKTISAYNGQVAAGPTGADMVQATFCFAVTTGKEIKIQDLTIDGASFSAKLGGAMYVETGAELTLKRVAFKNCRAAGGNPHNNGGAVYVEPHRGEVPSLIAEDCTFTDNRVGDGKKGRGGAISGYNANIFLKNCTFSGNRAGHGGAVSASGSTKLTVTGCTFDSSNQAEYGGDDIYVFDGYTFYKKTRAADSKPAAVLSGNTYRGSDGASFRDYRVICGRVLGDVNDTTNSSNAITMSAVGNQKPFLSGHDLTFDTADYNRMAEPAKNLIQKMPAMYDENRFSLVKAAGASEEELADFLANITSVTVDSVAYPAGGHGTVPVINPDGKINFAAEPFKNMQAGNRFNLEVKAVAYKDPLNFSVTIPAAMYGTARLTWKQFWSNEPVDYNISAHEFDARNTTEDSEGALDLGGFDAVSRATDHHGVYRGSANYSILLHLFDENNRRVSVYLEDFADAGTVKDGTGGGTEVYGADGVYYLTKPADGPYTVYTIGTFEFTGYKAWPVKVEIPAVGEAVKTMNFSVDPSVTAATGRLKTIRKANRQLSAEAMTSSAGAEVNPGSGLRITTAYNDRFGDYFFVQLGSISDTDWGKNLLAAVYELYPSEGEAQTGSNRIAIYGTKYVADTWWKSGGKTLQFGVNQSYRMDGSGSPSGPEKHGWWKITVMSKGYKDYSFIVQSKPAYGQEVTASLADDNRTLTITGIDPGDWANTKVHVDRNEVNGWNDGVRALDAPLAPGLHTVTVSIDTFRDINQTVTAQSGLTPGAFSLESNVLTIKNGDVSNYIRNISALSVDDAPLRARNPGSLVFTTGGAVNFAAAVPAGGGTTKPVFANGKGVYTLKIASRGYPEVTLTTTAD